MSFNFSISNQLLNQISQRVKLTRHLDPIIEFFIQFLLAFFVSQPSCTYISHLNFLPDLKDHIPSVAKFC